MQYYIIFYEACDKFSTIKTHKNDVFLSNKTYKMLNVLKFYK